MKTLTLLCLASLTACASLNKPLPPTTRVENTFADPSFQVQARANGLVKIDNQVGLNFVVPQGSAQVQIDCSTRSSQFLYADFNQKRQYATGLDKYSAATPLAAGTDLRLRGTPIIAAACEKKSDWRIVSKSETDTWVLIDNNGIEDGKDSITRFWVRFDYPKLALDFPTNAPYGQKIERFEANCNKQTYLTSAGFDLDANNQISDGAFFSATTPETFGQADPDYRVALWHVCKARNDIKKQPVFTPRKK